MEHLIERFFRYVKINTQSNENYIECPSTPGQKVLAEMLAKELKEIGLTEITIDSNGYLMATLPGNTPGNIPVIGFLAHLDTSPDNSGLNVKPRLTKYEGGDIILNPEKNIVLPARDFPFLENLIGQTLITTDGTTLLGADDKAGIAEIVTAMEYLANHPEIKHGTIRVAFTPDEEIGRGSDKFDVKRFNAQFAYTLDGGDLGELEYENFNAAKAVVSIQGLNVHPGSAKNKMKNAQIIAMEFNQMLPSSQKPEHTENYEGFFHLTNMSGTVENSNLHYIIRDHDKQLFEFKKLLVTQISDFLNRKYGENTVKVEISDQYYNMKEQVEPQIHIVELAQKAMQACGIESRVIPIRGGTDGARLSFMGLPCPNIFAGGLNFHSRYELVPVQSMEKAVEVIVKIAELSVNMAL